MAARLPPATRGAALAAMVGELATREPALAPHVLAALLRAEMDAGIRARWPDGMPTSSPRQS